MFIAENLDQFKKLFISKLKTMLSGDELGAFILVLANSRQDAFLKQELDSEIKNDFSRLKSLSLKHELKAPQDDVDVFNQLLSLDVNRIPLWKSKVLGPWEVSYNSMRELRPARAASQTFESIQQPFDENKFHFNKAFLAPEILWQGEYEGQSLRVLFNKFPFSDYHLLIAIGVEQNQPQLLTQPLHYINGSLVEKMATALPGLGIGFNSLAAGASVNHLHCQGFFRQQEFPIENNYWRHNGGDIDYPLTVKKFSDNKLSWRYIETLQQENTAFNCLYRNKNCYVITRVYQGSVNVPEWLTGAGWLDVAGVITVSDEATYTDIKSASITEALSILALS